MNRHGIKNTDLWTYISKRANKETIEKVENWMDSDAYDEDLFIEISSIYKLTAKTPNLEPDVDAAKKRFFNTINTSKPRRFSRKIALRYAAMAAILIASSALVYQFFLKNDKTHMEWTSYAEQKQIQLPDGSTVWLNSSTKLSYNIQTPRSLYLDGEAFFEVKKNRKIPFIVHAQNDLQVRATGTSFNVKSYGEGAYTETALLTGKVVVTSDKHFKEKIEMTPNDKLTFFKNENRLVTSTFQNPETVVAWKYGKIHFRNKPFKDIAQDLNIQYNVKITFENEEISNSKFTGSFEKNVSVQEILETLQLISHFNYKRQGENGWVIN